MTIHTTFSPGDRIWTTGADHQPHQRTVGQVRVTVTDTLGMDLGDGIPWDNFKACQARVEEYMCVETGIGSGSVYTLGKHAFATREECSRRCLEIEAELEREENERQMRRQLDAVQGLLERRPMLEFQGND